tara:strand:- start:3972 stop:4184 length:213 start_codon:yes stop_codon:yes gene_type:complete
MKWNEVYNWYKKPNGEVLRIKKAVAEDMVESSWVKLESDGADGYKDIESSNIKPNKGEKSNVREGNSDKK